MFCIDWYTRVVQCNDIGIIERTKNRKNMGLYRRPKIKLIRIKTGLIERPSFIIVDHKTLVQYSRPKIELDRKYNMDSRVAQV